MIIINVKNVFDIVSEPKLIGTKGINIPMKQRSNTNNTESHQLSAEFRIPQGGDLSSIFYIMYIHIYK